MRNLISKYEKIELLVCIYEISRGLVCKYWISKTTKPTVMLVIFVLHLNPTFVGNIFILYGSTPAIKTQQKISSIRNWPTYSCQASKQRLMGPIMV